MKIDFQRVRLFRTIICMLLMGLLFAACSHAPNRTHPQFSTYHQSMTELLVLVPEIDIFEKMPDGSCLLHDVESKKSRRQAQDAISGQLVARRFAVEKANDGLMQTSEVKDVTSLFKSVNRAIQLHVFGPQPFPVKVQHFQYDLGPVDKLLRTHGADGLVIALGYQTGERQPTQSWLSIALVEPQGRIIWYGVFGDHEKYDLGNPMGTAQIVARAMEGLPGGGS